MTTAPSTFREPQSRHHARTRPVDTDAGLLDLLPDADGALSWVRRGEGLVGWGEVARFEPTGPDRFERAANWWRDFVATVSVRDEVGLPGSGLVAFVSMAFDDDPGRSVLVVPEVIAGRHGDVTWVTEIGAGERPMSPMHPVRPVRTPSAIEYGGGQLSVTDYRDAVARAVRRLRTGDLAKVVLAHDLVASVPAGEGPIDPRYLLHGLAERYPDCWAFAVEGLIGATPELLLRRTGDSVYARVLAGTAWPSADSNGGSNGTGGAADIDALAAALLGSAKNQEEHRYAVESLAATLRPFCAELAVPARPEVLRLPNVLHLVTDVHGRLSSGVSLLSLAGATHPTAAVGGTPRAAAVALIRELEGMDRGRYAGPVGWVDANGDGELGLALRSAQITGNSIRLFAGCGIVADSDPDSEVGEAAAKFVPMREALGGTCPGATPE